jgi:hypothetical protein
MKGIGSNYPGGHKGSLYSGTNNSDCIGKGDRQLCPSDKGCPSGMKETFTQNGWSVCEKKYFDGVGKGINSGDSYGGYNSSGYPTGSGSGGGYGYSAYYDDDEDRYKYKGEYGVLGELDVKGVTGHGYTPRTQEALAYDNNDNLVPILVSPKRMAVWVNDLKTNPGRFQTTFYDKTMWSRPSYDPYMKRI